MSDAQGQRVEWDIFFRFVRNVLSRLFKTLFVERELSESIKEGRLSLKRVADIQRNLDEPAKV